MDARWDAMARAKLEELAIQFHRSRAAVRRRVIRWGLSREPSSRVNKDHTPGGARHRFFAVESELHQQVR
jgi:hypothetical protein